MPYSSRQNSMEGRSHLERGQPLARIKKFGLLEKHKDYVLRARDHHSKQNRLKSLKEKARNRNEDEFYFGMIKSGVKDGVHQVQSRSENYDGDVLKLLKSQDRSYIRHQRIINQKKISRLRESLGLDVVDVDAEDQMDFDKISVEENDDFNETPEPPNEDDPSNLDDKLPSKATHLVFVSSEEEIQSYSVVPCTLLSSPKLPEAQRFCERLKMELEMRVRRDSLLKKVEREMEMQNLLSHSKGRRYLTGKDEHGNSTYKWRAERAK